MKLRPFELALVIGFAILALSAVTMLSIYTPEPDPTKENLAGPVVIWGTLPQWPITDLINSLSEDIPSLAQVTYRYVPPEDFDRELVTGLADRSGPDLVLISHEELVPQRERLQPFTYEVFPLRDYRNIYVEAGEVFTLSDGVYGFPIAIDPLVLFWNRRLLEEAGYLKPPTSWEQLVNDMLPRLTVRDFDRTIKQATIALGETTNIHQVHSVLSMLLLQSGSEFVTEDARGYNVLINQGVSVREPLTKSLEFFMRFGNPGSQQYTWNRSLTLDRDMFIGEQLTMYFGLGSEAADLGERNPNLNYDIAEVPQGAAATTRRTYGKVYALALVRNANNKNGAATVLNILTSEANGTALAQRYAMAPARRSILGLGSSDIYGRVIYSAAITARGWLSPGPKATAGVFEQMVRTAAIDRGNEYGAANEAVTFLGEEYK